jgi:hypothetical protein
MKPIARWTIGGNSSIDGFLCLTKSVLTWKKVYHDEFDLYICHNNLSSQQLSDISLLGTKLIRQDDCTDSLSIPPFTGPEWKLYPPRISLKTEEIFIDNDLIIYARLPMLDECIETQGFVASSAVNCSHGSFNHLSIRVPVNTGFMCFPRQYDFGKAIEDFFTTHSVERWERFCDEQGMVSCLLKDKVQLIPMSVIATCHHENPKPRYGSCGTHFVGLNRGNSDHFRNFIKGLT